MVACRVRTAEDCRYTFAFNIAVFFVGLSAVAAGAETQLKVGAAAVDVTPQKFPVLINGGMTSNSAAGVTTPIHARAIALQHGDQKAAIVVVDSCMMPRPFLDHVKSLAEKSTGIPTDRMLISATHAHSAPASMGCLGTNADETYIPYLAIKIVQAIEQAVANSEPAQVGWASANAANYTAVRQWVRRPDRIVEDPFGNLTVRANMHAGRNWDDVTGEAGPEDPDLSLLSFQALDGRPIAVLANFSMHYFSGEKPVSADYFGRFSEGLRDRLTKGKSNENKTQPAFVGIMSHGCSGDIWRMDYTKRTDPRFDSIKIEEYTNELLNIAMSAMKNITYDQRADLAMAELRLHMKYRVPDKQRLEWAQRVAEKVGDRLPKSTDEVYALEQIYLAKAQETDVVVQALRIGQFAIASTPTETYALTGLKLKQRSPLKQTMVIELANGGDGYIPPPEQHPLGGYNTWAARSAGLEVEAEPKIAEAALSLLEQVSLKPRRDSKQPHGPEAEKIVASQPAAYYRLDEMEGPRAIDSSGSHLDGIYEPGVLFYLEGPQTIHYTDGQANRAAHLAGGRLRARVPGLKDHYQVSMWIWNGMPVDGREVAGWFFGRGPNHSPTFAGDSLGIAGAGEHAGKLMFQCGNQSPVYGRTEIPRWTWAQVTLDRRGNKVSVTINRLGDKEPASQEIAIEQPMNIPGSVEDLFFGGRGNKENSWEGRLDEIVVRRLSDE